MLSLEIKKYPTQEQTFDFVTTKKISIDTDLEVILQINFEDKNTVNILENKLIDTILTYISRNNDIYSSFSFVLKKINQDILAIRQEYNIEWINVFIWIIEKEKIYFSVMGSYDWYLVKQDKIENITEWMKWDNFEFSYVSSWELSRDNKVYLSNVDILQYLTRDDLVEISNLWEEDKLEVINSFLKREISNKNYDLILIEADKNSTEKETKFRKYSKYLNEAKKILEEAKISEKFEKIKNSEQVKKAITFSKTKLWEAKIVVKKNKTLRVGLFGIWIIVSIVLLYLIIGWIINWNTKTIVPEVYKNKLIEAKQIIDAAKWDIWNKENFDKNITKAENIIFEVREKQVFLSDIKKMLDDISVLKKQINWIEWIELKPEHKQYSFANANFGLIWVHENARNLYFVWKDSVIWWFVEWVAPKEFKYPDWEEAISSDVWTNWYIYILTKSNRIISFFKWNFRYETVDWQRTWEQANKIKCFNSNLYTINSTNSQIYKHKPMWSWFTGKNIVWDEKDFKWLKVLDIYIDWWVYVLKWDLTVDKLFLGNKPEKRSIIINSLPENYKIIDDSQVKLYSNANLNYLYILLNNKIWIFEQDSKSYKDVKSIKYIWQIEPTNTRINSVYIPKDWTVYIWDSAWIYKINFEVSDWKIITR